MAFFLTKTGTIERYLGANIWCGYYCQMTASSFFWLDVSLSFALRGYQMLRLDITQRVRTLATRERLIARISAHKRKSRKSILDVWTLLFTLLFRSILNFKMLYKLILNEYTLT